MPRGEHEIEPDSHGFRAGRRVASARGHVLIRRILAVHGGVPEAMAKFGGVGRGWTRIPRPAHWPAQPRHRRLLIKLMLNRADRWVGGAVAEKIHPAAVEQRPGGDLRASRKGVTIAVEFL